MDILMIAPTPFFANRGCHVRIRGEARALQERGHKVKIITYHHGNDVEGLDVERTLNLPWYQNREAGPSPHKIYTDILLQIKAFTVFKRFSPDVIHSHLHEGTIAGWGLTRFFDVPLVFDCQGSLSEELADHGVISRGSVTFKLVTLVEKGCYTVADRIILSSSQGEDVFSRRFSDHRGKSKLISDAVELDAFDAPYASPESPPELPEDRSVVVYTGLLNEYQGIDLYMEALPEILEKRPDVHFLIVGYPNVGYYSERAKQLGVEEHITFTGEVPYEEIPYYLNRANIAVSPKLSNSEGNLKLTDYMAAGLPIVVFDKPVNRNLLDSAGYYVNEETPQAFAAGIVELLKEEKKAEELAEAARDRAEREFSWNARARDIEDVYDQVL